MTNNNQLSEFVQVRISTLRLEAAAAGDHEMVSLCERALEFVPEAMATVLDYLADVDDRAKFEAAVDDNF